MKLISKLPGYARQLVSTLRAFGPRFSAFQLLPFGSYPFTLEETLLGISLD